MTSTVLPPATASVPMARAMFPVPIRVMLLIRCALFLFSKQLWMRSEGGGAAIGDQFQAVDVAGVVGGEEQRDGGDFLGAAHLSAGNEGLECGLGRLVEQFFLFGGGDLARGQDVDPDLAVTKLVQPDAGPGLLDGFASRVEAPTGEGAEGGVGS